MGNGKFKYIELGYSAESELNKPFEVIKNKWNSLSDGVYIAEIKCGSSHVALIQRITNGNYGAAYCFDYTASDLTPGILKKFANSWTEETLITNTEPNN